MARLSQPRRTVKMVLVRERRNGKVVIKREQYNIVSLDWGDGTEIKSYVEPTGGRAKGLNEAEELYDEVVFNDEPPYPKTRIGT